MTNIAIRNAVFKERWELVEELRLHVANCSNKQCYTCEDYLLIINRLMNAKV